VDEIHRAVGFSIPAGFLVLTVWSAVVFIRNRPPGPWYWNLLGLLQGVLAVQFVLGALLFISGARPPSRGPTWLHYVYGALFPAAVLVVAHTQARGRFREVPWLVFGVASLVCFGLTFRALQTGLGID
jgi:hypothetical protein